jgi:transcription elongation GreA/GreB family factor
MPVSLASLPAVVRRSSERGMREGIQKEADRVTHPKIAEKVGFAAGFTILLVGYGMQRRKERLHRIERKLDHIDDQLDDC